SSKSFVKPASKQRTSNFQIYYNFQPRAVLLQSVYASTVLSNRFRHTKRIYYRTIFFFTQQDRTKGVLLRNNIN
ncbi:unnamed protein product, partial [Amoebophrya sp. A25]